ncbi:MAG TPA: glycine cleavage system protein GcvH [Candidatus Polarisedimenticolia bacterium]|nr:glycine cleavage system protein GcvH [Candidatus Polarisedimenticolia bacterium]
MYPEHLKYTKDHEWIAVEGSTGTIGVTHFAQKELGDVVFVELPDVGRRLGQGEELGTIESVKAVSEIYCPVSGEVIEVNHALRDHPEAVNGDPYGAGWILKVRLGDAAELSGLMDAAAYKGYVGQGGH